MATVIQFDKKQLIDILHKYINNTELEKALEGEFHSNNPDLACSEFEGTDFVLVQLSKQGGVEYNIAQNKKTEKAFLIKDGDKYSLAITNANPPTDVDVKVPPRND